MNWTFCIFVACVFLNGHAIGFGFAQESTEVKKQQGQVETNPTIEIISARFGTGRGSIDCTERVRELVKLNPDSTTITSSGMQLRNRGGHFRDFLTIRYLKNGVETELKLKNAAKANLVSALKAENESEPQVGDGKFFPVAGAKDCCFDLKKNKLFVTTGTQLIILDLESGKVDESIDLAGTVVSCDISKDGQFLAIACSKAQAFYWVDLETIDIQQVRFTADSMESGVYDLCFGSDNSVLFGMTFDGSGGVKLRQFKKEGNVVTKIGRIGMDSIISPSSDRRFAAVAEGNISSGSIRMFDFETGKLMPGIRTGKFNYEIACASEGNYVAQPQKEGCLVYDVAGTKIGSFPGSAVIAAAFQPETDSLFLMRDKATFVEEYDISSATLIQKYLLPKALTLKADVSNQIVGNVNSLGGSMAHVHISEFRATHYETFRSGRLKMGPSGKEFFAVTPDGVYMFATKKPVAIKAKDGKPKRVIGSIRANEEN